MIGLSISGCVLDICKGKMKMEDVEKIVAGTCCPNEEIWDRVIDIYKDSSWLGHERKAETILRRLIADGKIEQPRLIDDDHYPSTGSGRWVKSEAEINWCD